MPSNPSSPNVTAISRGNVPSSYHCAMLGLMVSSTRRRTLARTARSSSLSRWSTSSSSSGPTGTGVMAVLQRRGSQLREVYPIFTMTLVTDRVEGAHRSDGAMHITDLRARVHTSLPRQHGEGLWADHRRDQTVVELLADQTVAAATNQLAHHQRLERAVHNQVAVALLADPVVVVVDAVSVVRQGREPKQQSLVGGEGQRGPAGRRLRFVPERSRSWGEAGSRGAVDGVVVVDDADPAALGVLVADRDERERPGAALFLRGRGDPRGSGGGLAEDQRRVRADQATGEHPLPARSGRGRNTEGWVSVTTKVGMGTLLQQVDPVPQWGQLIGGDVGAEQVRQGLRRLRDDQLRPHHSLGVRARCAHVRGPPIHA